MTALIWTQVSMNDRNDLLTVEKVFQKYAAFGGVHGFEFSDTINTFDPAKWTTLSNIAYTSTIAATGSTGGSDRNAWYSDDMPHSFSFEFTFHMGTFGVLLRGNGSDTYYRLFYDYPNYMTIYKYIGGVLISTWAKAIDISELVQAGRVKVAVRDAQFTSDSTGRAVYISIWIDDVLVYTIADSTTNNPPLQIGFIIPASLSAQVLYSDFRVANLGEIIPWSELDPGEHPMDAITRAIEDRYIKFWMRWNGKLKVYSPFSRSSTYQVTPSVEFKLTPTTDYRQAFSHLRILGAFQWVQLYDADLIREIGHRFAEINNTALWNTDDCVKIGRQLFLRVKEQIFQAQAETIGMIYEELDDRIQLPDHANPGAYLDYIIDGIEWTWVMDTFKVFLNARRYFY